MTRMQVPARDVREGDEVRSYPAPVGMTLKQGVVNFVATSRGATAIWLGDRLPGTSDRADIILNHGDPVRITRERDDEPKTSRWNIVGPDDSSLVDVYDRSDGGLFLAGVDRDEALDLIEKLANAFRGDV